MKKRMISILVVLVALNMGFDLLKKSKYVWRKSSYSYVKMSKADKKLGKLDQPVDISSEQMKKILTSIRYSRAWVNLPGSLGKKTTKDYDLFTAEEVGELSVYLAKALSQADSSQWVDFSLECFRGKSFIGLDRLTDGIAFVQDGKLNLVFRNVSETLSANEDSVNDSDPFKYYPGSSKLIVGPGQELGKTKKGKTTKNWMIIPIAAPEVQAAPPAEPVVETEPAPVPEPEKKEVAPVQEPPKPQVQPKPQPVKAKSEPKAQVKPAAEKKESAPQKSVKERLTELRDLYDKGLISEDEYNKKRKDILDNL